MTKNRKILALICVIAFLIFGFYIFNFIFLKTLGKILNLPDSFLYGGVPYINSDGELEETFGLDFYLFPISIALSIWIYKFIATGNFSDNLNYKTNLIMFLASFGFILFGIIDVIVFTLNINIILKKLISFISLGSIPFICYTFYNFYTRETLE